MWLQTLTSACPEAEPDTPTMRRRVDLGGTFAPGEGLALRRYASDGIRPALSGSSTRSGGVGPLSLTVLGVSLTMR